MFDHSLCFIGAEMSDCKCHCLTINMLPVFTVQDIFYGLDVMMWKQCFQSLVCSIFRYFLRATVIRRLNDISKETDIVVHTLSTYPELNSSIKMEVGIEDCLHIEFEYNKSK